MKETRKPGRPPMSPDKTRSTSIVVRLTQSERQKLETIASKQGCNLVDVLRNPLK